MIPFQLTKWYLDIVTNTGDCAIAYAANLHVGPVHLPLVSLIHTDSASMRSRTKLTATVPVPVTDGCAIKWRCRTLRTEGTWRSQQPPMTRRLYSSDHGFVDWTCLCPNGEATIIIPGRSSQHGLGYVERLDMNIFPRQLGLRQLRWGRFTSESESVIWITWEGEHPVSMVIHNGTDCALSNVEDHRVRLGDRELTWESSRVLRNGSIVNTALARNRLVKLLLPRSLTAINETKWLSRGMLRCYGRVMTTGWVIHEVVNFEA